MIQSYALYQNKAKKREREFSWLLMSFAMCVPKRTSPAICQRPASVCGRAFMDKQKCPRYHICH